MKEIQGYGYSLDQLKRQIFRERCRTSNTEFDKKALYYFEKNIDSLFFTEILRSGKLEIYKPRDVYSVSKLFEEAYGSFSKEKIENLLFYKEKEKIVYLGQFLDDPKELKLHSADLLKFTNVGLIKDFVEAQSEKDIQKVQELLQSLNKYGIDYDIESMTFTDKNYKTKKQKTIDEKVKK